MRHLTGTELAGVRGGIALLALALFTYEGYRSRQGAPLSARVVRWGTWSLAAVAVCAYLAAVPASGLSYHRWEMFHHYLGAKYQPELGYERLYSCTAVAEGELGTDGLAAVRLRRLRNLATYRRDTTDSALARPERCKEHFIPPRWAAFRRDVAFFRSQIADPLQWERIQNDHGYNASPLGTAEVKLLAAVIPATPAGLRALAGLDPLLLAGMFCAIGWAFGGRVLCLALLFWSTVLPGNEIFTAGALLREDWLFCTVLAACLSRRRYPFLAGGALAAAALLRVFPVLLFAGWLTVTVAYRLRHPRFLRAHRQAWAGALIVGGGLALGSAAVTGFGGWVDFAAHLRRYQEAPLANAMGLPQILAFRPAGRIERTLDFGRLDPFSDWTEHQLAARESSKPLRYALTGGLAIWFLVAVARLRSLWIALVLSLVGLVAAAALPCYYYSVFLLATLLGAVSRSYERAALVTAGASALLAVCPWLLENQDDFYFAEGLLFLAFAGALRPCQGRRRLPLPAAFREQREAEGREGQEHHDEGEQPEPHEETDPEVQREGRRHP